MKLPGHILDFLEMKFEEDWILFDLAQRVPQGHNSTNREILIEQLQDDYSGLIFTSQ